MTPEEFKLFGKNVLQFVADYLSKDCKSYPVLSSVKPGYLHKLLPEELPEKPEQWQDIMEDLKEKILPGISHWQSPYFHAYYPSVTSFPAIAGEILSSGLGVIGLDWNASPACTELEVVIMDWLAKLLNLPVKYLSHSEGHSRGVIQGSASESVLISIVTSCEQKIKQLVEIGFIKGDIRNKLVLYSSDQSNSCVEKGAKIAGVQYRLLQTGENCILTGNMLENAVKADLSNGNIPCICVATMGTTGTCAFDKVEELTDICKRYKMFIHVDAAYAGAAFCLPEFSFYTKQLENVDFFNINLHKLMNVNFDCAAMWCADSRISIDNLTAERVYLKNATEEYRNKWAPDYKSLQIPFGKRFRALKVWFTLRALGGEGMRETIKRRFDLAEYFCTLLKQDNRIRVVHEAQMGLVTFCLETDIETKKLLKKLNDEKKVYLSPLFYLEKFIIRFVVGGIDPQKEDMEFTFDRIRQNIEERTITLKL